VKEWRRELFGSGCGSCARVILRGQPVLVITLPGCSVKKLRCIDCAGEPFPKDLPELPIQPRRKFDRSKSAVQHVREIAGLFDFKAAQMKESE